MVCIIVGSVEKQVYWGEYVDFLPLSYSRGALPAWVNNPSLGAQPQGQKPAASPFASGQSSHAVDSFTPSVSSASVQGPAFGYAPIVAERKANPFTQKAEETFGDAWANDSAVWGTRSLVSHLVDKHIKVDSINTADFASGLQTSGGPVWQALPQNWRDALEATNEPTQTWQKFMGLKSTPITYGEYEGAHLKNVSELFSQKGLGAYKTVLKENFSTFLDPVMAKDVSAKSIFRRTILGGNLNSVVDPLRSNSLLQAGGSLVALGTMAWGIVDNTAKTWTHSRSHGEGVLTSLAKTTAAFVGQTVKAAASWEMGTIGAAFGAAIFSFGAIPATLGGVVVGALFGTLTHKAISTVVKDPAEA